MITLNIIILVYVASIVLEDIQHNDVIVVHIMISIKCGDTYGNHKDQQVVYQYVKNIPSW